MDGKKLIPSLKRPFGAILEANKTKDWLPSRSLISNEVRNKLCFTTKPYSVAVDEVASSAYFKS